MSKPLKVVAILTKNAALSAILHMVLADHRELRVREFESEALLSLYMHIAPVDLLICDYDQSDETAFSAISRLRAKKEIARQEFQVIALSRTTDATTRAACVEAGIDELMIKPMSPAYLEQRVLARLKDGARHFTRGDTKEKSNFRTELQGKLLTARRGLRRGNVVPLFGDQHIAPVPQ